MILFGLPVHSQQAVPTENTIKLIRFCGSLVWATLTAIFKMPLKKKVFLTILFLIPCPSNINHQLFALSRRPLQRNYLPSCETRTFSPHPYSSLRSRLLIWAVIWILPKALLFWEERRYQYCFSLAADTFKTWLKCYAQTKGKNLWKELAFEKNSELFIFWMHSQKCSFVPVLVALM